MIKTALKMNITLFMLLLIVSIPLVYADWSELTVIEDTNIITYEELAFLRENEPAYYIDYVGNKPYIRTNSDAYNIWNFGRVYSQSAQYQLNRDTNTVEINYINNGYIQFLIDVEPSQPYYLYFDVDVSHYMQLDFISVSIEFVTQSGSRTLYVDDLLKYTHEYSFYTRDTTRRLRIRFYHHSDYPDEGITFYNFWFNKGLEKRVPEYINRPAETYIYEHSDYTRLGAIILDSYNNFVDSLLNPLDTITDWLKQLGSYLWTTIKRIIDPEGIFLK